MRQAVALLILVALGQGIFGSVGPDGECKRSMASKRSTEKLTLLMQVRATTRGWENNVRPA